MEYLLSVVIPTKNRFKYLKQLLSYVVRFEGNGIEFVIQDNTEDNTEIIEFLKTIDCTNVKYFHTRESIPISKNSDLAISNSTGEYVCFIGDDDGVLPQIIEQVTAMKKFGYDAMLTRTAIYNWPDYKDTGYFHMSATLAVDEPAGRNYVLKTSEEVKKVICSGFKNMGKIPKVYQAVVKRSTLDLIYSRCGTFFPGPSPDMANAIALCSVIEEVWYNDDVTIITGQSRCVGGGERLMKELVQITERPAISKDILDYWDPKLPTLWCTDTIWPGSAFISANKMNLNLSFDYNKIYARFIFHHPNYKSAIQSFKKNCLLLCLYKYELFVSQGIKWILNRISYVLSGKTKIQNQRLFRNVNSIAEASDMIRNLN